MTLPKYVHNHNTTHIWITCGLYFGIKFTKQYNTNTIAIQYNSNYYNCRGCDWIPFSAVILQSRILILNSSFHYLIPERLLIILTKYHYQIRLLLGLTSTCVPTNHHKKLLYTMVKLLNPTMKVFLTNLHPLPCMQHSPSATACPAYCKSNNPYYVILPIEARECCRYPTLMWGKWLHGLTFPWACLGHVEPVSASAVLKATVYICSHCYACINWTNSIYNTHAHCDCYMLCIVMTSRPTLSSHY